MMFHFAVEIWIRSLANLDYVDQVSMVSVNNSVEGRPLNDAEVMLLAIGDGVLVCIQLYCSQLFNTVVSR